MPLQKFFYPRISYGAPTVNLDSEQPIRQIQILGSPVGVTHVAASGRRETLLVRNDFFLVMVLHVLPGAELNNLRIWWETWASKGKLSAITLDRLNTCAGQWEYDEFNTFFNLAELVSAVDQVGISPFAPNRTLLARALYGITLIFRQGR